jgi:hypothetical protein
MPKLSRRVRTGLFTIGLLTASTMFSSTVCHAGDKGAAESLFQEARRLLKEGRVDDACPMFAESHKADPSFGALANLAQCHKQQQKTASAWAEFKEAATMARSAGDDEKAAQADAFAAELEPTLSKVTIVVAQPVEGLSVKRDGIEVSSATFGHAVAVDPGPHKVEASAPGHETWSTSVTLGASADRQTVQVPPLVPGVSDVPVEEGGGGPVGGPDSAGGSDGVFLAGLVLGSVGVVGLAVGTVTGIVASGKKSEIEDECPETAPGSNAFVCPAGSESASSRAESAKTPANISTIGFIAGGALTLAGLVMVVASPTVSGGGSAHMITPVIGPTQAGLSWQGKF